MNNSFNFPKVFLDMDRFGWTQNCEEYVWFDDMEWYSIDEIVNWRPEERIVSSPLIVPFAHTGGGDVWGWYIEDIDNPIVVLCYHDDTIAKVYAKNFEEALFRHILEYVSESNIDCIDEAKEHILNWKNAFGRYFKTEWNNEIENILSLELKQYKEIRFKVNYTYNVLLTPQEVELLIQKYIFFDRMDSEVVWDIG